MSHDNPKEFEFKKIAKVAKYKSQEDLFHSANDFFYEACKQKYTYDFSWLGLPIIQFPEDIVMMQEILFDVKPDVIIETGIARGGSIVFYASLLKLMSKRLVIGIDIKILDFNRQNIRNHFLSHMIELVEGDSTSTKTLEQVKTLIRPDEKILVCLDSNHSENHVYSELKLFSDLVPVGSFLVVFDSTVETLGALEVADLEKLYAVDDWGKGNNPGSAVQKFLNEDKRFSLENFYESRALVSNCRGGILKRIR